MLPESGRMMSSIIRIVVVLPAPLGPSNPYTDPRGTWSDKSRTATCSSYRFTTFRMSIARSDMGECGIGEGGAGGSLATCTNTVGQVVLFARAHRHDGRRQSKFRRNYYSGGRAERRLSLRHARAS